MVNGIDINRLFFINDLRYSKIVIIYFWEKEYFAGSKSILLEKNVSFNQSAEKAFCVEGRSEIVKKIVRSHVGKLLIVKSDYAKKGSINNSEKRLY